MDELFFYLENPPLPSPRTETNNFSKRKALRQTHGRAFSWSFLFASDIFVNGKGHKINEEDINDKENPQLAGVRVGQAFHPV